MICPICKNPAVEREGQFYCTTDQIYLGKNLEKSKLDSSISTENVDDPGQTYQKRARKSFITKIVVILVILIILSPGIFYLFLFQTPYGYREKVMYQYGLTAKSRNYLRSETSIYVTNLSETKPFGFSHGGYWTPRHKEVKLNTASNEVAIHEFAHAWWEVLRKNDKTRKELVNDTVKLSKMEDKDYEQTILRAQWIIENYCNCNDLQSIDYESVDDHHFYAYMADFLMGRFKDGPHKLPKFMWKYFDSLFSNNLKVTPCYETETCFFPNNNKMTSIPNHIHISNKLI